MVPSFAKEIRGVKTVAPESAVEMKPVDHGGQRIGLSAIVRFAPLAAMPYQPGALEDGEVLGDGGLRHTRVARQCVDGLLAVAGELLKNGATGWIGKGTKHRIGVGRFHTRNHNHTVMVCQEGILWKCGGARKTGWAGCGREG